MTDNERGGGTEEAMSTTDDTRMVGLFAVRFPEAGISGIDDEPFDGDRERWLNWALKAEGPELSFITGFCEPEDVTWYGWLDTADADRRALEARLEALREALENVAGYLAEVQDTNVVISFATSVSARTFLSRYREAAALLAESPTEEVTA